MMNLSKILKATSSGNTKAFASVVGIPSRGGKVTPGSPRKVVPVSRRTVVPSSPVAAKPGPVPPTKEEAAARARRLAWEGEKQKAAESTSDELSPITPDVQK